MRFRILLLFLCLIPCLGLAQIEDISFRVSGFADTYHALRSQSPNDWMSSRSRVRAEVNIDKGNANLFVSLNAVHNSVLDDKNGFFIREANFRYSNEKWDVKFGRQIITWGVADGLRITDLVSPMDYTEFLAQDYDDIRIPVNGIRLKYTYSKLSVEGLFIPVAEFFRLPVDDKNPWSLFSSVTMPYRFDMDKTPEKKLSNSEYGGRVSVFLSGVDFSLAVLHTWNKMPVLSRIISPDDDSVYITANYDRMDMVGADISVPVGKFVMRAEAAVYLGELQETEIETEDEAMLKKNSYNALIGVDFYPGKDWTIMLQYSHKYISDYEKCITARPNTSLTTLSISKKIFQTTLNLSSFIYYDIVNNSLFSRSSAAYSFTDQIVFTLGYDWICGDKGMFAIYRNNSEYWVKAKFGF